MGHQNIPDDALLADLRDLHDTLGHPPRVVEIREDGKYDYETYWRRFGGLSEALEAAGIDPEPTHADRGPGGIDRDELLAELRRVADELGRKPTTADMEEHGEYSPITYYNHFDSYTEALQLAGFAAAPGSKVPEADLIEELRRVADELGRPPSTVDMRAHGRHYPDVYRKRFGSWDAALEAAGIDPE